MQYGSAAVPQNQKYRTSILLNYAARSICDIPQNKSYILRKYGNLNEVQRASRLGAKRLFVSRKQAQKMPDNSCFSPSTGAHPQRLFLALASIKNFRNPLFSCEDLLEPSRIQQYRALCLFLSSAFTVALWPRLSSDIFVHVILGLEYLHDFTWLAVFEPVPIVQELRVEKAE